MIKLMQGDCLELLKSIPDNSIDLVVTDPPYLIETKGGKKLLNNKCLKNFTENQLDEIKDGFSLQVLDELCRKMKAINIYLFCSQKQIRQYLNYFNGCNWNLLCWHKDNVPPLCGNKYLNDTEYCMFFRDPGVKIYGSYETKNTYWVTHTNQIDKKWYNHPTIKPLNIIENLVINSSMEGETVLDPFMGSGTTGVACRKLGRNFIGMEINEEYFKIAEKRINGIDEQIEMFSSDFINKLP